MKKILLLLGIITISSNAISGVLTDGNLEFTGRHHNVEKVIAKQIIRLDTDVKCEHILPAKGYVKYLTTSKIFDIILSDEVVLEYSWWSKNEKLVLCYGRYVKNIVLYNKKDVHTYVEKITRSIESKLNTYQQQLKQSLKDL